MKLTCLHCNKEFEGRKSQKFCSHSHRSNWWKSFNRLKKKKDYYRKQMEIATNIQSEYPQEVLDLYKK